MRTRCLLAFCFIVLTFDSTHAGDLDPRTVVRFGPAYKYPQDGWTVLHIGKVFPHHFCEGNQDCVIINKGDAQVILYYIEGGFAADYDALRRSSVRDC